MSRSTPTGNRYRFLKGSAAAAVLAALVAGGQARAGEADVVAVEVTKTGGNTFRFDVTVRHADTGWKHYADKWDVIAPDRKVLGTRTLFHPHEHEQPFTRSLTGVRIDVSIKRVIVRAHDKVDGYGGKEMTVDLPWQAKLSN